MLITRLMEVLIKIIIWEISLSHVLVIDLIKNMKSLKINLREIKFKYTEENV